MDLDGTLIATDLLWESICALLLSRPWQIFLLPFFLLRGRAYFKGEVARRVDFDPAALPYRQEVVALLKEERAAGRSLVLITAAHESHAAAVAEHLGLFDTVIASDHRTNCKGATKLEQIRDRFGAEEFDYVGDSHADLIVWQSARQALVVHPDRRLLGRVKDSGASYRVIEGRPSRLKALVKEIRPHQWAKNVLLAVPLIMSHQTGDITKLFQLVLGFLSFSLTASSVYVLNDLLDLRSDRLHPVKRNRPLASGRLPIPMGLSLLGALLGLGLGLSLFLPPSFAVMLVLYLTVSNAYSLYFKRKVLVDVICLAGLYTLRILAGGELVDVWVSPWLMSFSMFFFLSLAFVKRYTELSIVPEGRSRKPGQRLSGRGYMLEDTELVMAFGICCGMVSLLVLCLYINSPDVLKLYRRPELLWLICPILLYWIGRVWFLARRQEMVHDPVIFALRDRHSYLAGVLTAAVIAVASVGFPSAMALPRFLRGPGPNALLTEPDARTTGHAADASGDPRPVTPSN